ncbi:MAG: hypothetical protein Q4C72_09570 [Eubacteriales bacterium]|nr:hypothetical protein [Eubacteriales bacterium]
MTPFDEQLSRSAEQLARQKKLRAMLSELYEQRDMLESRVQTLAAARAKEQKDVDRLEGRSLAALFYGLTGRKGEKLDKEQQEAYAAAVKHDSAVRELAAVRQDIAAWEKELAALDGCEKRYAKALAAKTDALRQSDPACAEQILRLEERLAACAAQQKELDEAVSAGQAARAAADAILSSLDSAEGWGTFDLLGGGLVAGLAKHGHLDDAQERIETLQVQLRRFKTELSDVAVTADVQARIDGFLRFADYFFDGIFADWAVLDHIHESQAQMQDTRARISDVLGRLYDMQTACVETRRSAQKELDELVLRA